MQLLIRCIWANKVAASAYATILIAALVFVASCVLLLFHYSVVAIDVAALCFLFIALAFGVSTDWGKITKEAYERSFEHFQRYGSDDRRFGEIEGQFYCNRSGYDLALRDFKKLRR